VLKGIIENLPVDSNSVDWVISNCVINLSPEKPKVFKEIARVLKPGGKLAVSDIVAEELPEFVRKSEYFYNTCVAGAISESEYIAGLQAAGLVEVEVRERLKYDRMQILLLVESDLACCGQEASKPDLSKSLELVESMANKVWSAKFFAKKPAK
jgi:arsenite methyltransferase